MKGGVKMDCIIDESKSKLLEKQINKHMSFLTKYPKINEKIDGEDLEFMTNYNLDSQNQKENSEATRQYVNNFEEIVPKHAEMIKNQLKLREGKSFYLRILWEIYENQNSGNRYVGIYTRIICA